MKADVPAVCWMQLPLESRSVANRTGLLEVTVCSASLTALK